MIYSVTFTDLYIIYSFFWCKTWPRIAGEIPADLQVIQCGIVQTSSTVCRERPFWLSQSRNQKLAPRHFKKQIGRANEGYTPKNHRMGLGVDFSSLFLLVFLFSSEAAVSFSGVYASKDGEDGIPESSKESPESVFAFRSWTLRCFPGQFAPFKNTPRCYPCPAGAS